MYNSRKLSCGCVCGGYKKVSVMADDSLREAIAAKLKSMGYPEYGSVSGLDAGLANTKSFVSCAIGRVS
jgi:copper chaperone